MMHPDLLWEKKVHGLFFLNLPSSGRIIIIIFHRMAPKDDRVKLVYRIIVKHVRHHKGFLGAFMCFRI
jgi:hypothetical protein